MGDKSNMRKWILRLVVAGAVVFVVIQVLPVGRIHNPPVTKDAPWPSEQARSIAVASCYDCHSNEVKVRWYDKVAPVSWFVANHVVEGRSALNFSTWDQPQRAETDEWTESVENGGMPLRSYTLLHPDGKLSAADRKVLVDALRQLEGTTTSGGGRGEGGRGGDDG
jgi:hypothetical protein